MTFGFLELTLRPLKLAFLVGPADNAALAAATQSGQPYQIRLDPGLADPRVAHPPRANKLDQT